MRTLLAFLLWLSALCAAAQAPASVPALSGAPTIMVVPFENRSGASGLDWIGEAFPVGMSPRLAQPGGYAVGRQERLYAFDRLGIPTHIALTRATLYRVAEELDVDYLVFGNYNFDGRVFSAEAELLDVRRLRLLPPVRASGPLTDLFDVQHTLAWELLRQLNPQLAISKNAFLAESSQVRLDAFENYVRGTLAPNVNDRIRLLRQAIRLHPRYSEALLLLGKTYYDMRDWQGAAEYLARVPREAPQLAEANFYLGLTLLQRGSYESAEQAFRRVFDRLPLTEVVNNLGVTLARQGKDEAQEYFQRAADADPRDADYRYNLAIAAYRSGDAATAAREIREALTLRPQDAEARTLQQLISTAGPALRVPATRLKSNYDESSFRQLALEIRAAREARLAQLPPPQHAAAHAEQGDHLLQQGLALEAEREFREAIVLDPANAAAHSGLARVLMARTDLLGARSEARAALQLEPTVERYLLLAEIELRDNNTIQAEAEVDRALALDPQNQAASEMKQLIATRLAGGPR